MKSRYLTRQRGKRLPQFPPSFGTLPATLEGDSSVRYLARAWRALLRLLRFRMSKTESLYGLFVGDKCPEPPFYEAYLDGIRVKLAADYEAAATRVPQNAQRVDALRWEAGRDLEVAVELRARKEGTWVATAIAEIERDGLESILLHEPSRDDGIWDLCQMLTFITGRVVTTQDHLHRNRPDLIVGSPLCIGAETLRALIIAWQKRRVLVDRGLVWAFLNYTEALRSDTVQTRGFHMNAAMNVLVDALTTAEHRIKKPMRTLLKQDLEAWLKERTDLDDDPRSMLIPRLNSAIDSPGGLNDRTIRLLQSYEVLTDRPTEGQLLRVGFINRLRNALVHRGTVPELKGLDANQSLEYAVNIVGGVVPEIVGLVLGQELGFTRNGLGSLSQYTDDLQAFFTNGSWRGYPIATTDFQSWVHDTSRSDLL